MAALLHKLSRYFPDSTCLDIANRINAFPSIVFLFFLSVLLSSCNTDKEISQFNSKSLGIEEIKNADINYTLGGKAKAKLRSPLMLRVQETTPYVEFPKTLHVDFFNENGEVESRLDARYGKYFEQESKVFLKDSVKVTNVKGDTLYCNELWWDRSRVGREFYTDKPVRIRKKMEILDGTGMESAQDFKNWILFNPSQGIMRIPNSQFPVD
ncbi:MAG TPA: LPS export ABC transporter periplasmic protein LptC [Ferruginibacter sp.]|nr:LPS export ABC transporter periplasmic protein LptC [Ferruginibacter sp.]